MANEVPTFLTERLSLRKFVHNPSRKLNLYQEKEKGKFPVMY